MVHFLGIDIGTSGTKTLVLSDDGTVLATHTVGHDLLTPKPGWTEQHPEQWWDATRKSVKAALKKAKCKGGDIAAVGFSGQMHGSVFVDKKGNVIRPALLWNDQRTAAQSERITELAGGPKAMMAMTGNLPLTGYTAPKILWLRDNEPKHYKKIHKIVLPKDYVRWQMTGDWATDVGDASGMALLDVTKRDWSHKLLGKIDVDPELLPALFESSDVTGELHAAGAKALGLKPGTPVVGGSGDVMTGAVGNGIVIAGLVNANLGTGGVVAAHSDEAVMDPQGRVATMCHAVKGGHVVFGCMLSAAGSFQWYGDMMSKGKPDFAKLTAKAEGAPAGCEGLFFLPYLTGERCPHNDPQARGGWIGLTRRTDEAALIRSLLEGVTFNMGSMLNIMRDEMGIPCKQVRGTGGGSKSAFWRQMQADIYGAPLALTNSEEGAAFGAALLAAVGAGAYKDVPAACKALIKATDVTKPVAKQKKQYAKHHAVYDKLYGDLKDRFADMAALSG
ncbi:MAG: xylulokinase [Planctomycetota bacterium]